ncbi:ATP-binding protein [Streptomyces sp. NPDC089799]|uniref:ATP-binding protein n=1 Tax=Streptomyces sp. NPDC089799 TaxID=3155066 RepID=UPI00344560D3
MRVELPHRTVNAVTADDPWEPKMILPFTHPAATLCPIARDTGAVPPAASPDQLTCSVTLPAGPRAAAVARQTVRAALYAYALAPLEPAAVQAASELVGSAWRMDPEGELYLSVRYRDGSLRLISYDGHPEHAHPRLAAHCEARRRATLRVLAAVVRDHGGNWGFGPSREPGGGNRSWVSLPG